MQHSQFNWQAGDGLQLYAQAWQPEGEPRAAVCLVHGLGEHSGRYAHVATALTGAGYALLAFDLRGHGKSAGQRGHAASWDTLLDDAAQLLSEGAELFPNRSLFLYGHSLGGNLVLSFVLRRKETLTGTLPSGPRPLGQTAPVQRGRTVSGVSVAGAIVTGPLLRAGFQPPPWKIKLGETLYSLWPTLSLSNELDVKGLSRDSKVVESYVNDPLVHNRISARLGIDMLRGGEWALAHAGELSLPVLLMHGAEDPLCSPQASAEFARRAPVNCTFQLWDGLYHEIHNEPEQQEVLQAMIRWLDAHLPA